MEEPKASETIINVDKNDEDEEEIPAPKRSLFSRLNPFHRKEDEDIDDEHEQDPFFRALHNSFQEDNSLKTETTAPLFQNSAPSFNSPENNEPSLSAAENETSLSAGITEKDISSRQTPTFGSARSTLDSLRSSNDSFSFSAGDLKADKADEPKLNSLSAQANAPQTPKAEKKENLAYPFGGWTDEDNYR